MSEGRSFETIHVETRDGVSRIKLNRPEVMNALTTQLLEETRAALEAARDDGSSRCIVITGEGRAFCAGADLSGQSFDKALSHYLDTYYHPVVKLIATMPKPVIAAVNGVAAGAGMSLALACDMRLLSSAASFTTAFSNIGLTLDAGGSYFLPKLVGRGRAFELSYTSRKVRAQEAMQLGLGEMLFEAETFQAEVDAFVGALARGATTAFACIKQQLNAEADHDLQAHLQLEAHMQDRASNTKDFAEGVQAFLEKRPAVFEGA